MKSDKELWAAYCRKRFRSKPLIDDENTLPCLMVAYRIGFEDGMREAVYGTFHKVREDGV